MPDVPSELYPIIETLAAGVSDELMGAWTRGVCDGLEVAARMTEGLMPRLDPSPEHEVLRGLGLAIRQAQMRMQVDQ